MDWNESERRLPSWRPGEPMAMANDVVLEIAVPSIRIETCRIDDGPPRRVPCWDFGDLPKVLAERFD